MGPSSAAVSLSHLTVPTTQRRFEVKQGGVLRRALARQKPSTPEEIESIAASDVLSSCIGLDEQAPSVGVAAISHYLNRATAQARLLRRLVSALNALPAPSQDRTEDVGAFLVPIAAAMITAESSDPSLARFKSLFDRTHLDEGSQTVDFGLSDWKTALLPFLVGDFSSSQLPASESYLSLSLQLKNEVDEIARAIKPLTMEIADWKKSKVKAEKEGKDHHIDQEIDRLEGQVHKHKAGYDRLFPELLDVKPEEVPEVLAGIGITFALRNDLWKCWLEMVTQAEQVTSVLFDSHFNGEARIDLPLLQPDGTLDKITISFDAHTCSSVRGDSRAAAAVIDLLHEVRSLTQELAATQGDESSAYGANGYLFGDRAERSLSLVCAQADPTIRASLMSLFSGRVATQSSAQWEWTSHFENITQIHPLHWLVRELLLGNDEQAARAEHTLRSAEVLPSRVPEFLRACRGALRGDGYGEVARLFVSEIQRSISEPNHLSIVALACALDVTISTDRVRERLKNQISNVRKLQSLQLDIVAKERSVERQLKPIIDRVIRGLTPTLADYYRGPGMDDLFEAIEDFRLFLDNPEHWEGAAGNESQRSGILLIGEPGVGKTSVVEAIEGELGIKVVKIEPSSNGTTSVEQQLSSAKKAVDEVKQIASQKKAVLLFIDEAESLAKRRSAPNATAEEKALTCYLLQEIDELRKKYPYALIIAATNYFLEIDEGMTRQGRFDYHIFCGAPDEHMRKNIILGTLAKERLELTLSDAQLQEVVLLTAGWKPLPIKRTLIAWHKKSKALAARGTAVDLSVDALIAAYKREGARLARQQAQLEELVRTTGTVHSGFRELSVAARTNGSSILPPQMG